jgi:MFS family permease
VWFNWCDPRAIEVLLRKSITQIIAAWLHVFEIQSLSGMDPEIVRYYRRNFVVNGLDAASWTFGFSLISISAVLPVYARHITDSPIIIGLIPALNDFGFFFPQLFLPPLVEKLHRKYPLVLGLGALERVPYLVLPFAVLWLDGLPQTTAVILFILLMAWKSIGSGIVAIPWQEMIAKIIPVTRRGRFFSTSHLVGQVMGIGGAALAAVILAAFPYPQNFAICFACGAVGIWMSYIFLALAKEPSRPPGVNSRTGSKYSKRLGQIMRQDVNFRNYIISRWTSYMGMMAFGFVAVYAVIQFELPDSMAAVFTGILLASGAAGFLIWGPLGDHLGHKRVMELTAVIWILGLILLLVAILTQTYYLIFPVFALMGLSNSGGMLSDFSLAMEFGPEGERPTYMGMARGLTAPALLLSPILGGWIAQTFNYQTLFLTSLICVTAGLILLRWQVKDPRFILPIANEPYAEPPKITSN